MKLRKTGCGMIIVLLAINVFPLAFDVQPVRSAGTIYIRADGSVDPPSAPIWNVGNVYYTFAADIYDSIVIERDNVVVNGAGHVLEGAGTGNGITIIGRSNVTIKTITIRKFDDGIYLSCSSGNTLCANKITDNSDNGIIVYSSSSNSISKNTIANSDYGISLHSSSNNLICHNNFAGNIAQVTVTPGYANIWDDGYPSGGNYWSDYTGTDFNKGPNLNAAGTDEIGDAPYVIDANNQDNYPLMNPWAVKTNMASLVVRGSNNIIYYRTYSATTDYWNDWTALPSTTIDRPAATICDNELHMVVRGMDGNTLWHGYVELMDQVFSGWTLLSGSTPSAPTLTSNGTVLSLVVRGNDNRTYFRTYSFSPSRGWSSWNYFPPGLTCDRPAAAMNGDRLHVVIRSNDGTKLWHSYVTANGTFSGWTLLSGSTPSAPTLTAYGTHLCLTVRGQNNQIYYRFHDCTSSTWAGWNTVPTGTTCDAPAATVADNKLHIVVRSMSGTTLWHGNVDLTSSAFSGWTLLDGSTLSAPELAEWATSDLPEKIHLTWQRSDTARTITVTWQTYRSDSGDTVLYDTIPRNGNPELYQYSAQGTNHSYPDASGYIHEVELEGLTPDTAYYFICGGDAGGWSSERAFRTAPSVSCDVRFVAGGDSRTNVAEREKVSKAMAKFNPAFVMHCGDMVADGCNQSEWDVWFTDVHDHWIGENNLTIPIIPVVGNHENPNNPATKYFGQFALPGNEKWYSCDWGPDIHVICLDSEDDASGPQLAWLEDDLAAHVNYTWKFVLFHNPPFVNGSHAPWTPALTYWVPLFDKYHVDIVFNGHEHSYQRTCPLNWTASQTEPQDYSNGTMYIVSGGWGAPLYAPGPIWYMAYQKEAYHFVLIDVFVNGTLHMQAKDGEGVAFDEVWIYKREEAPACLAVRGLDNRIYYRFCAPYSDYWGSWSVVPTGLTCDSPAATACNSELHMIVRGMDGNTLWHGYVNLINQVFTGWTLLSGSSPSAPTLTSNGSVLSLVVRGADNRTYFRTYSFSPRGWSSWNYFPPGLTCDRPAAAMCGDRLHVVIRSNDGTKLWHSCAIADGTFSGWTLLSGSTPSAPTLTANSTHLCLVVRGQNNRIYYRFHDCTSSTWADWNAVPTGTTCDGPAATVADNKLHIVVRGMSGTTLWHGNVDLASSTFVGWTLLDGSTPSAPTLTR